MSDNDKSNSGYVYILEVADIDLPVCKIGMTTRTPHERCHQINNSSTGDFIWAVAHSIAVDDCKKLEALVHSKLTPLKQKRREFFNINADDAYKALISIFENQTEIKIIESDMVVTKQNNSAKKKAKRKNNFQEIDQKYTELLQTFTLLLGVKGRPFGQLNQPHFGISDGNEGVQWNLSILKNENSAQIGVNLEGIAYKNWPISKFILSEINDQKIENIVDKLKNPNDVYIRFSRDAWQVTSRPSIVEKYLGGKEFTFAAVSSEQWTKILKEALACLNKEKNYRGRAKQQVTYENIPKNGERIRIMEVSPHLTIWSPLDFNSPLKLSENMENKFSELQPVYDWVVKRCQS